VDRLAHRCRAGRGGHVCIASAPVRPSAGCWQAAAADPGAIARILNGDVRRMYEEEMGRERFRRCIYPTLVTFGIA
jgi:hypothetical protein